MGFGLPDFSIVFKFIPKIIKALKQIGDGSKDIVTGLGEELVGVPIGAYHAGLDLSELSQYVGVFLFTNFICAIKSINNFTYCILYYILDIIGQIIYFPFRLIFYILHLIGLPSYDFENFFWSKMETLDRLIYTYIRVHIIHWPKNIRDKCYNCKKLKITAFAKKLSGYSDDLIDDIIPHMVGGLQEMLGGVEKILTAFSIF
jgi:hypothetical protein